MNWVTNNPVAATVLRAADAAYERAKSKATDLPLAEKIVALRIAKQIREAAYKVAGTL